MTMIKNEHKHYSQIQREETARKKHRIALGKVAVDDLRHYLNSEKFHENTMVQTSDIHLRLDYVVECLNGHFDHADYAPTS